METGEPSQPSGINSSSPPPDVWAMLAPLDAQYSDIELRLNDTVIRSKFDLSLPQESEWCEITRNMDLVSATLHNKSGKEITVDNIVIGSGDSAVISCGSEITPGCLSYRFKIMPTPETSGKHLKILLDADNSKCCICLNVWHDVVTAAPCLHNYCNGCFSEWLRRSQEKRASVLCPQCRAAVHFVGRNHFLHCIEEDILQADCTLRRSDEEIAVLDSYASIKSPLVIARGTPNQRKRRRSSRQDENLMDLQCPQCGSEYAGYQCNQSTIHLQCHACGTMMPSRRNTSVPQHCVGCDKAICGAYWPAQGVTPTDSHRFCSPDTLKPIADRAVTRLPYWVHEKNRHEQDITENCIRRMGRSLQDVIAEWLRKMDNREFDQSRMPLNHAETITSQTYTCVDCYGKLVSVLLYWFRITMPSEYLSPEAAQRQDCWYGYACRTQHHNEEHARKRNHVCRPTRGSHF